jgi:hypothetical protein
MSDASIPVNHFDRSKPFYPLVMNYLIQLTGIKELLWRALAGPPNREDVAARIAANRKLPAALSGEVPKALKQLDSLLGPLELRSEFEDQPIVVPIDELASEFISNYDYVLSFSLRAAGSLLILAHETCKDQEYYDKSPLWEFLRHCRNAAAHGGKFHLRGNEPVREARWGLFQVDKSLNGTNLFKDVAGAGLLSVGDPIRLLWDIEESCRQKA